MSRPWCLIRPAEKQSGVGVRMAKRRERPRGAELGEEADAGGGWCEPCRWREPTTGAQREAAER